MATPSSLMDKYNKAIEELAEFLEADKDKLPQAKVTIGSDGKRYVGNTELEPLSIGPGTSGRRRIVEGLGDMEGKMVVMPKPGDEYYKDYVGKLKGRDTAETLGQGEASKRDRGMYHLFGGGGYNWDDPLTKLIGWDRQSRLNEAWKLRNDPKVNPGGEWSGLPWWAKDSGITKKDMIQFRNQHNLSQLQKPEKTIVKLPGGASEIIEGPSLAEQLTAARIPLTSTDPTGKQVLVYKADGTPAIRTIETGDTEASIRRLLSQAKTAEQKQYGYTNPATGQWVPPESTRLLTEKNRALAERDAIIKNAAANKRKDIIEAQKLKIGGIKYGLGRADLDQAREDTLTYQKNTRVSNLNMKLLELAQKQAENQQIFKQNTATTDLKRQIHRENIALEKEKQRISLELRKIEADERRQTRMANDDNNPLSWLLKNIWP